MPTPELVPQPAPSQISLKTVFTVCFGVVCVAALVLFLLKTILSLTLTLAAAMIAVALNHGVDWFQKRRAPRGLAIAAVMLIVLALIAGFFGLLVPPAVSQGKALVKEAPTILAKFKETPFFHSVEERFHVEERLLAAAQNATRYVQSAVNPLLAVISSLVSAVAAVVSVLFLVVFMLIFGGPLVRAALAEALPERRARYGLIIGKIYRSIGGYLGGLLLICTINATLTTTFLAVTRTPFFLPLGILSGSSSLIPYAGPAVMGASISLLALATGGVWKGLATAIYFILYGQLEGNVLAPIIFRRTVHINPLVTLISILFLAELAGIAGAIIAVPAVAAAQIIVRELLETRREQLGLPSTEAIRGGPSPIQVPPPPEKRS